MSEKNFEAEFYEWTEKTFRLKKAMIERSEQRKEAAENIIEDMKDGLASLDSGKITYSLIYPIDSLQEITMNTRIKYSKSQELAEINGKDKTLKFLEAYSNTPISIIGMLDLLDVKRISGVFSFL